MIINEILSPLIRASCTHAGATKVTVFRKTAKNQEVICLQAGQSASFPGPGKRRRQPSAPPVRNLPPHRDTPLRAPAPTRRILRAHQPLAAQSAGRVVCFAPFIDAALLRRQGRARTTCPRRLSLPPGCNDYAEPACATYLYRLSVSTRCHTSCVALAQTICIATRRPLSRMSAPLSLPSGCADNAEPAGTDYLRSLSAFAICGAPSAAGRCPSSADSPPPAPRARFQPRARR